MFPKYSEIFYLKLNNDAVVEFESLSGGSIYPNHTDETYVLKDKYGRRLMKRRNFQDWPVGRFLWTDLTTMEEKSMVLTSCSQVFTFNGCYFMSKFIAYRGLGNTTSFFI